MGAHFLVFIGVAAIVIVLPGPDTAVVTKNVLVHGRRAALGTSLGVSTGLSLWTVAAALGVASVVRTSAVAFTSLKLIGALYLVWLGLQALRAASRAAATEAAPQVVARQAMGARGGFRQGLLSDLANPKIGVFFTSLLPQFVDPGQPVLLPSGTGRRVRADDAAVAGCLLSDCGAGGSGPPAATGASGAGSHQWQRADRARAAPCDRTPLSGW